MKSLFEAKSKEDLKTALKPNRRSLKESGYKKLVDSVSDRDFDKIHKLATEFNAKHDWGIAEAGLLAYLVCEDANWHSMCKEIEKLADKEL